MNVEVQSQYVFHEGMCKFLSPSIESLERRDYTLAPLLTPYLLRFSIAFLKVPQLLPRKLAVWLLRTGTSDKSPVTPTYSKRQTQSFMHLHTP